MRKLASIQTVNAVEPIPNADAIEKIRVLGWASNFANVSEAMDKYKGAKEAPKHAEKPENAGKPGYLIQDEVWNSDIPYPIPASASA